MTTQVPTRNGSGTSYSDSSGATFMDKENFDQVILPKDVLGDALLFLRPNAEAVVLFYDGNAVSIELPASVDLMVKDCPPEVKGATVTNQTKDALMETGLTIRVPAFIKQGETTATNQITIYVQNPSITLTAPRIVAGSFQFNASGLTIGKTNVLQVSTNLASAASWVPLATNVAAATTMSFTNAATASRRFFRLFQLP